MTWCNGFNDVRSAVESSLSPAAAAAGRKKAAASSLAVLVKMCPSCGHRAQYEQVHSARTTLASCTRVPNCVVLVVSMMVMIRAPRLSSFYVYIRTITASKQFSIHPCSNLIFL